MLLNETHWATHGRMSFVSAPGSLEYHPGEEAA
jgi:hypothetical protein